MSGVNQNVTGPASSLARFTAVLTLLAALMIAPAVQAQSTQAIQGLVTDSSGGVVPGAKITISNLATGVERTTESNSTGNYSLPLVEVGDYAIICESTGFKTGSVTGLRVSTGDQARQDFVLEVGAVTETVEVSALAQQLDTENAIVGGIVENKRIIELPLNGRNVVNLAVMTPGVQFGNRTGKGDGLGGFPIPGQSFSVSANGQREIGQVVSLDGVDAKDPRIHITNFVPSVEALEEFKIQTNAYDAEVGFGAGAVVNMTMKSGTNDLHGTAFWFIRNDKIDAENYFLNFENPAGTERSPKDKLRRNQFGGFIGGPIIKNKTFWSFNYEGRRERRGVVQTSWFPNSAFRSGDFSELLTGTINPDNGNLFRDPILVYDAFTGDPYPNNILPASVQHPGSQNVMQQFVPQADFRQPDPLDFTNRAAVDQPIDTNNYFGKVDHHFSDKDRIFGRIALDRSSFNRFSINPNFPTFLDSKVYNFASAWVHTFSPTMINEFHFGFNIANDDTTHPRSNDESFDMDALGVGEFRVEGDGNRPLSAREHGVPDLVDTGISGSGQIRETTGGNGFDFMDSVQFRNSLTIIKGKHNIKVGGEFYFVTMERAAANLARGRIRFNSRQSGHAWSSYLLGLNNRSETAEGLPRTVPRAGRQGYYIQDDWKATSKLTVNMGIRFDYNGNPRDVEDLWRTIDFVGEGRGVDNFVDPDTGTMIPTMGPEFGQNGVKLWKQRKFILPRLGLAYRLSEKTVLRAGAGYFDNIMHQNNFTILNLNPPKSGSTQFDSVIDTAQSIPVQGADGNTYNVTTRMFRPGSPVLSLNDPFLANASGGGTVRPVNTLHVKPDYRDGDVWKWSFDIQRQLPQDILFQVGYVGSKGSHVANSNRNWNSPDPSPDSDIQSRRPFPRFFDVASPEKGVQGLAVIRYLNSYGNSFYHGLQMKLDKRYSNGLAFGLAYTYSKSHGDGEQGGNEHQRAQDPRRDRGRARGRHRFDQRHNLVGNFLYELPGANIDSALRHVIGGWQVNGIVSLRSGFPVENRITGNNGDLNVSDLTPRPDIVGDPRPSNPNRKLWFNPGAFQRVTCDIAERQDLCHYGNFGYNVLDAPGQTNFDLSFYKNFDITEDLRMQFRSEFYNAFNTPYFGQPGGLSYSSNDQITPDGSRNGEIRSLNGSMRIIQFGLKLMF